MVGGLLVICLMVGGLALVRVQSSSDVEKWANRPNLVAGIAYAAATGLVIGYLLGASALCNG